MPAYHIVIDFEMNPVRSNADCPALKREIVEFGAVKIDDVTKEVIDMFSSLVAPQFNSRIEPVIKRLTGIRTRDIKGCTHFAEVLGDFLRWVGTEPVRVYSWSISDLFQLREECDAKDVVFPRALTDWVDFQARYSGMLGCSRGNCMSLEKAAIRSGVPIRSESAHRALYDARITAQLLQVAMTGMYQIDCYHVRPAGGVGLHSMKYAIGDACASQLGALLQRLKEGSAEEEAVYELPANMRAAAGYCR